MIRQIRQSFLPPKLPANTVYSKLVVKLCWLDMLSICLCIFVLLFILVFSTTASYRSWSRGGYNNYQQYPAPPAPAGYGTGYQYGPMTMNGSDYSRGGYRGASPQYSVQGGYG